MEKLVLVVAIVGMCDSVTSHTCHHVPPPNPVYDVPLERPYSRSKRTASQPMRIHITYDMTLQSLQEDKRHLIQTTVLPQAVNYWQKALRITRPSGGPVRLLKQCKTSYVTYRRGEDQHYCMDTCKQRTRCGEVLVPNDHLLACRTCSDNKGCRIEGQDGPGVPDTDFVLYVGTKKTKRCGMGTTVAYAAYCQLESELDRPIAGYVNICPDSISTEAHELKQIIATIKHEILHALGFSAGLFAFYRDGSGRPLTPRHASTNKPEFNQELQLYQWSERVVRKLTRPAWQVRTGMMEKTIHMVVTPRVVREVRRHFNCSTLEGAELEDQGIIGTALTHWEKRVYEHEAMTGTYTQNPVISRITLALMEDTGWYTANYDLAQDLDWGKNLGCDFVTKSCMSWMESKRKQSHSIHPFCDRPRTKTGLRTECSADLSAVALCNLIEYTEPLPIQYQHMSRIQDNQEEKKDPAKFAGSVELADYCPYIQEFTWKENSKVVRNSHCSSVLEPGAKTQNLALEEYGNNSVCVPHEQRWILRRCDKHHELDHWGSGCYVRTCSPRGLVIHVAGKEYLCVKEGHVLRVKHAGEKYLHVGTLVCPACEDVCGGCPDQAQVSRQASLQAQQAQDQQNSADSQYDTDKPSVVVPCHAAAHTGTVLLTLVLVVAGWLVP